MLLNFEQVTSKKWQFAHLSGFVASNELTLSPDGRILGYDHPNERYWEISGGCLCFLNHLGVITVRFEDVSEVNGRMSLSGAHIPKPSIVLCLRELPQERAVIEGMRAALAHQIDMFGWEIGTHSYGNPTFFEQNLAKFNVGKYSSVAAGVKVALGNHRTDTVSTYPFKALQKYWRWVPSDVFDHSSNGDVNIGNDVWIGADAIILSGVSIGDGAVVGAGSVVTKNVDPYSIVVGNPARHVKFRFAEVEVRRLLACKWWEFDDEIVDELLPLIMADDIGAFLDEAERIRSEMK